MLTKKHFKELAGLIAHWKRYFSLREDQIEEITKDLIVFCGYQNPRFNEDTFREFIEDKYKELTPAELEELKYN
jgi:hypothetical protein